MAYPVVLKAIRTPIGKMQGSLAKVRPDDLLVTVFKHLEASLALPHIDEVFVGCANQAGEDSRNVARLAVLLAGWPVAIPAITLNRLCGSGMDAVVQAARAIAVGDKQLVIAAGVESASRAPYVIAKNSDQKFESVAGWRFMHPNMSEMIPIESMGQTAENIAAQFSITRLAQDRYALHSHEKACMAWQQQKFADEIVPVNDVMFDECPRADLTLDMLQQLGPAFKNSGSVTVGNSSLLNDGAAGLLISSQTMAETLGIKPLAKIRANASVGVHPSVMGLGPIPAIQQVLKRANLKLQDIDLIELSEAFAAQSLAVIQQLELDPKKVNIYGGALALGNPIGCTGTRLITTLVHGMQKTNARYGLAAVCVGLGQGCAVILERC